jgi:hypothetical protein
MRLVAADAGGRLSLDAILNILFCPGYQLGKNGTIIDRRVRYSAILYVSFKMTSERGEELVNESPSARL